mgnify:CR=1 FL=1
MKVQIAIIAGGLAIASGVAYAELKPSSSSMGNVNTTASPLPTGNAPQNSTPQNSTQEKNQSGPSKKLTNPNSATHIQPPRGGGEGEGDNRSRGEHEGGFFGFGGEEDD